MKTKNQDIAVFNAFDLSYLALFAERQRCVKRALKVSSKKYDKNKTEFELHYIGAMGEWAVRKIYPTAKLDFDVYDVGDNGIDLIINGWSCQVKTFAYQGSNIEFFLDDMSEFKANVCIGAQVLSPIQVKILGCISRKRFMNNAKEKDYGYGTRLCVPNSLLSSVQTLINTNRIRTHEQTQKEKET